MTHRGFDRPPRLVAKRIRFAQFEPTPGILLVAMTATAVVSGVIPVAAKLEW